MKFLKICGRYSRLFLQKKIENLILSNIWSKIVCYKVLSYIWFSIFCHFFSIFFENKDILGYFCSLETQSHFLWLKYSIQIYENSNCPSPLTFVVPVFQGVDVCGYIEREHHFLWLNYSIQICENSGCQSPLTFVVPVFQGCDVSGYMETEYYSLQLNYSIQMSEK